MKTFAVLLSVLVALARSVSAGPFTEDAHTLFLAHFDKSLLADVARGDPKPTAGAAAITAGNGGRFGEGVICKPGPAKDASGQTIQFAQFAYALKDNIELARGTLEFWTRIDDLGNVLPEKTRLRYLFDIPSKEKDSAGNLVRVTIVMTERDGKQTLYVFPGTLIEKGVHTGKGDSLSEPVTWSQGEWHHVAITWDGDKLGLFLDGKAGQPLALPGGLFGANKTFLEAIEGGFTIGGLHKTSTINSPEGIIDEFRISNTVRYQGDFDPTK